MIRLACSSRSAGPVVGGGLTGMRLISTRPCMSLLRPNHCQTWSAHVALCVCAPDTQCRRHGHGGAGAPSISRSSCGHLPTLHGTVRLSSVGFSYNQLQKEPEEFNLDFNESESH